MVLRRHRPFAVVGIRGHGVACCSNATEQQQRKDPPQANAHEGMPAPSRCRQKLQRRDSASSVPLLREAIHAAQRPRVRKLLLHFESIRKLRSKRDGEGASHAQGGYVSIRTSLVLLTEADFSASRGGGR
jgi:hypothetical protein